MGHGSQHSFELMPTQDHSTELGHTSPYSTYLSVFIALLVFTFITVLVSRFDFGSLNLVVAMLVASVKAMLVALFFMHLKYERATTWLYAAFPLVLLAIMMGGIFMDNPTRAHPVAAAAESAAPAKSDHQAAHH